MKGSFNRYVVNSYQQSDTELGTSTGENRAGKHCYTRRTCIIQRERKGKNIDGFRIIPRIYTVTKAIRKTIRESLDVDWSEMHTLKD